MVFWTVEFLWPDVSSQRNGRRGFLTDVAYWFFTPLVSKPLTQLAVLLSMAPPFLLLGRSLDRATILAATAPS